MNTLNLKINAKKRDGQEYFEGTVSLPGLKATKLMRSDGTTEFASRANVSSAARNVAKKLNLEVATDQPVKKAAKKTAKGKSECSSPCTGECAS